MSTPSATTNEPPTAEERAANRHRFEFELEFVQSLANPHYLSSLAQQNILSDPSFILYLEYLQYWTEPEYARFIVYPHALHHLTLLQNPKFRDALKNSKTGQWLSEKQFEHWRTWRSGPVPTLTEAQVQAQIVPPGITADPNPNPAPAPAPAPIPIPGITGVTQSTVAVGPQPTTS